MAPLARATYGPAHIELETGSAVLYAGDEKTLAVTKATLAEVYRALGHDGLVAALTE